MILKTSLLLSLRFPRKILLEPIPSCRQKTSNRRPPKRIRSPASTSFAKSSFSKIKRTKEIRSWCSHKNPCKYLMQISSSRRISHLSSMSQTKCCSAIQISKRKNTMPKTAVSKLSKKLKVSRPRRQLFRMVHLQMLRIWTLVKARRASPKVWIHYPIGNLIMSRNLIGLLIMKLKIMLWHCP